MAEKQTTKVKITNLGTMYRRAFTDIPYSKEIAGMVIGKNEEFEEYKKKRHFDEPENKYTVVPLMEARYKVIDAILRQVGINQVVEIAAGWSPRGLILTEDARINYVDTDQDEDEMNQKKSIFNKLLNGVRRQNLHFVKFDAVNGNGISEVRKLLKPGEVCVIHEGLFRYLTHEQKAQVLSNIRKILQDHNGVYITNDIETNDKPFNLGQMMMSSESLKQDEKTVSRITGSDIEGNRFGTINQAQKFFEDNGFDVKKYLYGQFVNNLSSVETFKKLNPRFNWDKLKELIASRDIWCMTPR